MGSTRLEADDLFEGALLFSDVHGYGCLLAIDRDGIYCGYSDYYGRFPRAHVDKLRRAFKQRSVEYRMFEENGEITLVIDSLCWVENGVTGFDCLNHEITSYPKLYFMKFTTEITGSSSAANCLENFRLWMSKNFRLVHDYIQRERIKILNTQGYRPALVRQRKVLPHDTPPEWPSNEFSERLYESDPRGHGPDSDYW